MALSERMSVVRFGSWCQLCQAKKLTLLGREGEMDEIWFWPACSVCNRDAGISCCTKVGS